MQKVALSLFLMSGLYSQMAFATPCSQLFSSAKAKRYLNLFSQTSETALHWAEIFKNDLALELEKKFKEDSNAILQSLINQGSVQIISINQKIVSEPFIVGKGGPYSIEQFVRKIQKVQGSQSGKGRKISAYQASQVILRRSQQPSHTPARKRPNLDWYDNARETDTLYQAHFGLYFFD